jgi:hypothetical protein
MLLRSLLVRGEPKREMAFFPERLRERCKKLTGKIAARSTLIITILALLGALALVLWRKWVEAETFKVLLEFLLVGVIGGWLSYEYKRREQGAAAREAGRVLQREMLTKVIDAYGDAKKVRRLLRAKAKFNLGNSKEAFVRKGPYEKQMERLMDIQLEFEALKHRAENNADLFPKELELAELLEVMEKYLNEILKNYETRPDDLKERTLPEYGVVLPLRELKPLREFTDNLTGKSDDEKTFRCCFSEPFHDTVKRLQALIIQPDPADLDPADLDPADLDPPDPKSRRRV